MLKIPNAPKSIQKGTSLKLVLDQEAVTCLANNISHVYPDFPSEHFRNNAMESIEPLGIMERGVHIAKALRLALPQKYEDAIKILLASLTPANSKTEDLGLAVFFYHPHGCYIAEYGLDKEFNDGEDPFAISMHAQYELTKRFTAEFAIRPFLIQQQDRTLSSLLEWLGDPDPHVRRLCSEGTRPRLPWAPHLPAIIYDPTPILPILEKLKDDPSLYVRRSVANHLGDIAKDHLDLVLGMCDRWLSNATKELKWVIRHALRNPAKKGNKITLEIRTAAK